MRRVLIRLGVVVLVIVSLRVALPFIQARRLSKQLISDIETLRARELVREPPIEHPLHDNGFECLRDAIANSPTDLTPFAQDKSLDVGPWVRGEARIDTLPSSARERMTQLASWAAGLRACSSSRALKFVPGLSPWESSWESSNATLRVLRAFDSLTSLELQRLLAEGQADVALDRCVASQELLADATHASSMSFITAQRSAEVLLPTCARAFARATPEQRHTLARRVSALKDRGASWQEFAELSRLSLGTSYSVGLGSPEFIGAGWDPPLSAPEQYLVLAQWRDKDAALRELAAGDRTAARRADLAEAHWWPRISMPPYFDHLLSLLEVRQQKLELLPWIAEGAHGAPPCCTRVDGGVEWPKADGGVEFLPISAP